jgi:GST-like protein
LILPDGGVLSESAAIVLHLAETRPDCRLAPASGDRRRPAFLNRLVWFVSALYPTFTYRDYPERWAPDAAEQLIKRVDAFRKSLWEQFEQEVDSPWVLGRDPSALDLYVAVFSHWRPRREWLSEHCPKLHGIALATERLPQLAPVMVRNFPA